jgi:hypothetical protein
VSARYRFVLDPIEALVRGFFKKFGYEIIKVAGEYSAHEREVFAKVRPYTGTSLERISSLIGAIHYVSKNRIAGDFVECGVWRGGSMMVAMLTLLELGDTSRDFFLFDTYEGMTPPTEKDVTHDGTHAGKLLAMTEKREGPTYWCYATLEDVQKNVFSTGYPRERIHFIKGRVEDTLPAQAPRNIALLRLDTDWYESTLHEMTHLYPLLGPKGVLILDDYGYWQGSRRAVDEYFAKQPFTPLLHKLDFSGRLLIKPG